MENSKGAMQGEVTARLVWVDSLDVEPRIVDELHVQNIGGRIYLTLGQTRVPIVQPQDGTAVAEVRPIAKILVAPDFLAKVHKVIGHVLSDLKADAK